MSASGALRKIGVRRLLQVTAPLVAILTMMIGLRVGAKDPVRAAAIFGAPPGRDASGQKTRLAWQLQTFLDDRGVRETIPITGLSVVARSKGHEARWTGASNEDGIAEVALAIEGLALGDPIDLEIRAEGDPVPLASGPIVWSDVASGRSEGESALRPTSRTGAIGVDVLVEGGRVVPGFVTSVWVHATPPSGMAPGGLVVDVAPEPGLEIEKASATTCEGGWAEVPVTAYAHVVGAGFRVRGAAGDGGPTGTWFGALPVAPGAFFVSVPRVLPAGAASAVVLVAPNPRNVVYAELNDESGRVAAEALRVVTEPGDPTPRARFSLPPLARGLHWLVVSGEPRGAERLTGATIGKPILVGQAPGVDVQNACSVGPWLARRPAAGFARWVALDGTRERSAKNRGKRVLGLAIAVASLLSAGVLEVLLLIAAARGARVAIQLAELDEGGEAAPKMVTARPPGGGLAVAVLLALLGFALLAALLVEKG